MPIQVATLKEVIRYGVAFSSQANLTANAPETVLAAASNTAGVIVWRGNMYQRNAAGRSRINLIAKTSAPTGVAQGDVLASNDGGLETTGGAFYSWWSLREPLFIAAGKGIYILSDTNEEAAIRSLLYTVLP